MATLDQAVQQMLAAGMPDFPPGHPRTNTDRIVRYGPGKRAFYRLWETAGKSGRYYVAGMFGMWGAIDTENIKTDWEGMEREERERLQRAQAEAERREKAKRAERAQFAGGRAEQQWQAARPSGACPYLVRKGLMKEGATELPEKGLRVAGDGTLYVPMIRYDVSEQDVNNPEYTGPRRLAGLQKIAPDGVKRFNKGMAKEGVACRIGKRPKDGQLLIVGEGLATVLSAHLALEKRCTLFVAFDSGNLLPVGKILRKLYPKSPILFLADDDAYLEAYLNKRLRDNHSVATLHRLDFGEQTYEAKHGALIVRADMELDEKQTPFLRCGIEIAGKLQMFMLRNPGRTAAWNASAALGNAWVYWPKFAERKLERDPDAPRLTDFNDLQAAEGLDQVREQLTVEIKALETAIELSAAVRAGVPEAEPGGKSSRKKRGERGPGPPARSFDWGEFFQRFTLIYPTETAWDEKLEAIVKVSAMRLAFGKQAVDYWLESPDRRMLTENDVVFDPSGKAMPPAKINLHRGMPIKPAEGECGKLLNLLHWLCDEKDNIFEWVLKWAAYPLQHPGAKMATAIVMHGQEGTGKNLFWGAVAEIYGKYGAFITQFQLESRFNDWMSCKQFVVANEVVTRVELRHVVGYLKNLVTEPRIPIEVKNMPLRYEDNHMQIVFLSNELRPLFLSPGDRRYLVVKTPGTRDAEYYAGVADELAAGGSAALHHYLLNLQLGDFGEHSKPIETDAKRDLIELGLSSTQLFWNEMHEGIVPLPYGPCLSTDLYRAYSAWCTRNGEKMPSRINLFSHEFMSMNGVTRRPIHIADPDRPAEESLPVERRPTRKVFLMGIRPEDQEETRWVKKNVDGFRAALRDYLNGRGGNADSEQYGANP